VLRPELREAVAKTKFVLSPTVDITPVSALEDDVRRRFTAADDSVALTRVGSRTASRVVDGAFASLLEQFRSPRTITSAVIEFCRARGEDPAAVLTNAHPILHDLIHQNFLITTEARATPVERASAGERFGDFLVTRAIQVLEDVQVFQARAGEVWAAVKVGTADAETCRQLEREASILHTLAGTVTPRLLANGLQNDQPYIVTEWCSGSDPQAVASELRAMANAEGRMSLLRLAVVIADAYATLHAAGVAHGDVHPRNVIVGRAGCVRLLDFGYARRLGAEAGYIDPPRAGVPFFEEPELAAAELRGRTAPLASAASDQFGLAALVYTLFTGAHHQEYSLERSRMLAQLARPRVMAFRDRGTVPWPDLERVLRDALSPLTRRRPASVAAFRERLGNVALPVVRRAGNISQPALSPRLRGIVADVLNEVRRPGVREAPRKAPTCSLYSGAAGVAYALYLAALARSSGELLALADLWAERVEAWSVEPDAFRFSDPRFTLAESRSLYHGISGVQCVRGLIAAARGDLASFESAVVAFIASATTGGIETDLTMGAAGAALGAALLLEAARVFEPPSYQALRDLAMRQHHDLIAFLDARVVGAASDVQPLGLAHGWAGYLFAALRLGEALGEPPHDVVRHRLDELLTLAEPTGRGMLWPWLSEYGERIGVEAPGWCNGAAGMTLLLLTAWRCFGTDQYRSSAESAGWFTYESDDEGSDLCCGLPARGYALLALFRATRDAAWLRRAMELGNRAADVQDADDADEGNLFRGRLGLALLAIHLELPEAAAMPTCETSG
jgi:serine/threonine protein kinase